MSIRFAGFCTDAVLISRSITYLRVAPQSVFIYLFIIFLHSWTKGKGINVKKSG
jgi:hypothetical protein